MTEKDITIDQPDGFANAEDYTGEEYVETGGYPFCPECGADWEDHWAREGCKENCGIQSTHATTKEFIEAVVENAQQNGYYTGDPRESQNIRYEAIQQAAQLAWRILDTHTVGDTPVGKAFDDIKHRLKWSAESGQGLEDLV